MGKPRSGRRPDQSPGPITAGPAALVVPAVPSFSVDDGFWYSIPDHLSDSVSVGTIVRVPLGGRRVRGYVVDLASSREGKLKDLLGVSGDSPVFDRSLLKSLRWAATHYVAPVSVLLEKAAPPTLPGKTSTDKPRVPGRTPESDSGVVGFVADAIARRRRPVTAYATHWADAKWGEMLAPFREDVGSCLVVLPTFREAGAVASLLAESLADKVVLVPEGNGAEVTRAWERANSESTVLVGTPRTSYWSIADLVMAVVFEEGRRAMKDRQTPTVHVRDLLRTRARVEGFALLFVGPTPSVELIAAGAEMITVDRPWGLVEVVDRREDPPGSGFLSERSVAALRSTLSKGGRGFVFTHLRAGDSSFRCVKCRAVRLCRTCGSHVGRHQACPRCGTVAGPCVYCGGEGFESMGTIPSRLVREIAGKLGGDRVGEIEDARPVTVGTERDLAGLSGLALAIAVDVDALSHGQNYRASEEALRVLARLVGTVGRGRGFRTILQTSEPESPLVAALRRAQPIPYLEEVLARRARDGFPPASEMMAIETRSVDPGIASSLLQDLAPGMVLGPVENQGRHRWLIQGALGPLKADLRAAVGRLRDSGATVRVDVDPIDL